MRARACNKFRDDLRVSCPNPYLFIQPNNTRKDHEAHTDLPIPLILSRRDLGFRVSMHSSVRTVYHSRGFIASTEGDNR